MEIKSYYKYYLGCEVYADEGTMTYILKQLGNDGEFALFKDKHGNEMWLPPNEWKMCLRRLSSITEEEAIDIYTLERDNGLHLPIDDHDVRKTTNGFIVVRLDLIDTHIHIGFEGQIYKTIQPIGKKPYFEIVNNWPAIFHYLISKGFWLWHPDVFETGLIIEKK